ncbi:DNA repair protein RecO [Actinopolymorpha pittospori]|uniref:DNA repair protein RecO n=1 Tax=Actinopolymorpha pittospori TaxID=648752 RepID=A0A927RAB8_9ACTN|nr:DNA repair protein RecO (recombination protein O) [Actinopolymorpha pittospori]
MAVYVDEAIVLRTHKLGEADRIITLLTRHHGRVRAVAKGVRRTTSRFGARLEPCSYVELQLAVGRSLDIITQAEIRRPYAEAMYADYGRYTTATAMLETAERLTVEEREPATQQFLLLVAALRALAEGAHAPGLVLDSYLLRSLSVAGYAPSFDACARCGSSGPHRAFAAASGGMVCADCRPAGVAMPAPETIALLGALLAGEWAVADPSALRHRREATGLVSAYLQWHLERGLRSLPHVERLEPGILAHPARSDGQDGDEADVTEPGGTGPGGTEPDGTDGTEPHGARSTDSTNDLSDDVSSDVTMNTGRV